MDNCQRNRLRDSFTNLLVLPVNLEANLKDALRHVLRNHGSFIRPEIILDLAIGYGLGEECGINLAISLEYFHTASLLFDDLPSMDNAIERRGVPCVHVQHGEAGAILAGLALVNRAYSLAWQAAAQVPGTQQAQALALLEHYLGVGGLLHGQSMDLNYSSLPSGQKTAEQIAFGKTVSLMRITLLLPATLGGATSKELHLLNRAALFWGLAYQIADDLKDILQSSYETGKSSSRDEFLGRPNLALILGTGGALQRLQRLIMMGEKVIYRLVEIKPSLHFLRGVCAELNQENQTLQAALSESVGAAH